MIRPRLLAASLHLLVSAAVAALAAGLVFGLWYPGAFRVLAGGRELFLLVMTVDVITGPLLTLVVFDPRKPRRSLRLDLGVIGLVQLAGLLYGLHTVFVVRPVAMVFEVDRFRMITASDVNLAELPQAPAAYQALPLTGPWLLGARQPKPGAERNDALFKGVAGMDIAQRPLFWVPYADTRSRAVARSRPVSDLIARYGRTAPKLERHLDDMGVDTTTGRFLPTVARGDWVAVMNAKGDVIGYLPFDGFF